MTDAICVLDEAPAARRGAPRRLTSPRQLALALAGSKRHEVWVLRSAANASDLIRALASARPGVRRSRLVAYERPDPIVARVIESVFERALIGASAMVAFEDLTEIVRSTHPEDHCVGAEWDKATKTLALWRGDLTVLVVPITAFPSRGGVRPDPADLAITDGGQTLRMGEYEASVDSILFERDALYRRRARKRMLAAEQGLGPSIRRRRLAQGAGRDSFPGLDEKTLARIERGEVGKPHPATMQIIAKRLGVTVEDLSEY